ncbi:MAG: hypothetical protein EBR82_71915, partial [Caulobacteraceae bacterium]|nr:hypothetical protein [Caulobacteraceae bacterium]
MFDPSFFSFGNGLFYNPMTDSVVAANTATVNTAKVNTAKVKGREYDVDVANNLKNEIANQTNVLGVNHQASFSKDQDKIITDMANQLASYGVTSLADLKENKYTVEERDPFHYDDSEAPMVTVEKKEVINSKTGEVIPLNELNNSAGKGFTWYNIDFVDGQAVPYAWKEATGAGALGDQIQSIVSIPPIAAALTAGLAPTIGKELASAVVQTAATGDIGAGLQAGATSFLGGELKDVAKDLGLDNIFDFSEETVKPTT